jgi:hypothetical protein
MDLSALQNYSVSTEVYVAAIVASIAIGALLLMLVVRWTDGFWISFGRSLIVTTLAVVAAILSQVAVFAVLIAFGLTGMSVYWLGLMLSILFAAILSAVAYAFGVKRPTGEQIGIARAIKVTVIQLGLTLAVAFAFALLVAFLVLNGVITLPELPSGLQIR